MRSAGRQQARGGAPLTSPPLHVPSPAGPPQAAWPFSHCSQGPQTLKPPSVHVKQEGDVRPASCEGGLGAARIGECPTDGDEGPRAEAPARGPAILGQRAPCHSRSAGGRPGQAGGSGPSALRLPWPGHTAVARFLRCCLLSRPLSTPKARASYDQCYPDLSFMLPKLALMAQCHRSPGATQSSQGDPG